MKLIEKMERADLAAFVQKHLRYKGIDVVLSGGACVSIYSQICFNGYRYDTY